MDNIGDDSLIIILWIVLVVIIVVFLVLLLLAALAEREAEKKRQESEEKFGISLGALNELVKNTMLILRTLGAWDWEGYNCAKTSFTGYPGLSCALDMNYYHLSVSITNLPAPWYSKTVLYIGDASERLTDYSEVQRYMPGSWENVIGDLAKMALALSTTRAKLDDLNDQIKQTTEELNELRLETGQLSRLIGDPEKHNQEKLERLEDNLKSLTEQRDAVFTEGEPLNYRERMAFRAALYLAPPSADDNLNKTSTYDGYGFRVYHWLHSEMHVIKVETSEENSKLLYYAVANTGPSKEILANPVCTHCADELATGPFDWVTTLANILAEPTPERNSAPNYRFITDTPQKPDQASA